MALIAVGLMLIFGVMGVVNFAHGEPVHARRLLRGVRVRGPVVPLFPCRQSDWCSSGVLGIAMERTLFRPVRDNPLAGLIVSIGLLLMLQAAVAMGFGVRMEHIAPPTRTTFDLFGSTVW